MRAGLAQSEARSKLHFAPEVEARLLKFAEDELHAKPGWLTHLRRITVLPLQQRLVYRQCDEALTVPLRAPPWPRAAAGRAASTSGASAWRAASSSYLGSVVRVAQFSAFERMFALWHVAHVPFVYLLLISAIVHVIAVPPTDGPMKPWAASTALRAGRWLLVAALGMMAAWGSSAWAQTIESVLRPAT